MIEYKSHNSDLRQLQAASFCGVRILKTIHLRRLGFRRPCVRDSIKFWGENVDQDPHWVSQRLEITEIHKGLNLEFAYLFDNKRELIWEKNSKNGWMQLVVDFGSFVGWKRKGRQSDHNTNLSSPSVRLLDPAPREQRTKKRGSPAAMHFHSGKLVRWGWRLMWNYLRLENYMDLD